MNRMNRVLLSGVSVLALTTGARADDFGLPSMPLPVWTGPYVGANIGGAFGGGSQGLSVPTFGDVGPLSSHGDFGSGLTGGVQGGYNFQFTNGFVAGVEGDINYINSHSSLNSAFDGSGFGTGWAVGSEDTYGVAHFVSSARASWFGTARARLGYAWDQFLFYGTAGVSFGDLRASTSGQMETDGGLDLFYGAKSRTMFGWAAGAGGEYAITPSLGIKLEFLHYDLGSFHYAVNATSNPDGSPVPTLTARASASNNILRTGINWHF